MSPLLMPNIFGRTLLVCYQALLLVSLHLKQCLSNFICSEGFCDFFIVFFQSPSPLLPASQGQEGMHFLCHVQIALYSTLLHI